jgi:hypothetical protein
MSFGRNINFVLGQGGFGTPLPGNDYISGMLFTSATLPTGFSYSVAKEIFSLNQAVSLGIVGDYSGETKAVGQIFISSTASVPSVGTVVTVKVTEPAIQSGTNVVTLASYTVQSTDSTATILTNNIINTINIGTSGYSAGTLSGGTFSVTARSGVGTLVNSVSPVVINVSASITAFSGGVIDPRVVENYQIAQFFAENPNGVLWVMYQSAVGSWNNINLMQQQSSNAIRQFGIYNVASVTASNITSDISTINGIGNTMFSNYAPASVIYSANISGISDMSTLPNLTTLNCPYVSTVIGADGNNLGAYLALYTGTSVTGYGAVLGLVSLSKVSDNIGWVANYNIINGSEFVVPAFGNGNLFSTLYANNNNLLTQLDGYGYIFLQSRPMITGTWVNNSWTAALSNSDYKYIERVRTIDKVVRQSYLELVPLINSPILLESNGIITPQALTIFQDSEKPSLDAMVLAQEISSYKILIDPNQNVQTTGQIAIVVEIVGIGVARNILVTVGYVLSI